MLNINRIQLANNDKKPVGNTVKPQFFGNLKPVLSQDSFVKINQPKSITFKGLTRDLSNHLYATKEQVMLVVDEYLSKNKGIAGSMPHTWVENISQSSRNDTIKEVYSQFAEAVEVLNNNSAKTLEASNIMTSALAKAGIIDANEQVNLEFVNYGSFGTGYLFETPVNGTIERYVLKISPEKRFNNLRGHGLHLETNRALFVSKNAGKNSDRAPFYFADFKSGYMLVKCIDGTLPQPKNTNLHRHCLAPQDDKDNTIYQHKIEYGGLLINSPASRTKTSRWVYKQIFDAPVEERKQLWLDIFKDRSIPNREEVELGLAATIKFLPNNEQHPDLLLNSNPSKSVKLGLLNKSFFSNGYEHYDQIMEDADLDVRFAVADAISTVHINKMQEFIFDNIAYLKTIELDQHSKDILAPTSYDLITSMIEKMVSFTDQEKIAVYDELLSIADDKTKAILAKNLYTFEDKTLQQQYFEILAKDASIDVINALIPSLNKLDSDKAKSYIKEYIQIDNDETRSLLVRATSIYPESDKVKMIKQLASNCGPMTQLALINSISSLPEEERYSIIKENLPRFEDLKTDALIRLVHQLYLFPKDEGYEIYDALTEDLSAVQPKLLAKLFTQLKYFHDDKPKQQQMFRQFATVKNNALRSKMLNSLDIASESFKVDFVRTCAKDLEGKDSFLVTEIVDKFALLPANEIQALYREFYSFNEPQITQSLIHQIEYLPEEAIGRCVDVFVNDFKLLKKELQDHFVYLVYNSNARYSISEASKAFVKENMDPVQRQKIEAEKAGYAVR